MHVVRKHGEKSCEKLEDRVSRRMTDLKLVRRCDELTAVPEGSGRFDGQEIGHGSNHKNDNGGDPVPQCKFLIIHTLEAIFSLHLNVIAEPSGNLIEIPGQAGNDDLPSGRLRCVNTFNKPTNIRK